MARVSSGLKSRRQPLGTELLKMLLSQAEDICHCIREARRIFGYRHYGKRLSS